MLTTGRFRRFGVAGRLSLAFAATALAAMLGGAPKADAEPPSPLNSDLAVFTVQASHGYELSVFADRSFETVAVFVSSAHSTAIYRVPAIVTAKTVKAEIGPLGKIAVKAVPGDRKPVVLRSCDGKERLRFAPVAYEGVIEFHGEEGFTEVEAKRAPFDYRTFREFVCAEEGGRPPGRQLPGARLGIHRLPETNELSMAATQRRPGSATEVWVQIDEGPEGSETTRATEVRAGPDALRFDPQLRSATLSPPAPFAGRATYRRFAPPGRRWTGNLTVDLPGKTDYPLTGPGLRVTLEHPTSRPLQRTDPHIRVDRVRPPEDAGTPGARSLRLS